MAFVFAGLTAAITLTLCFLEYSEASMSDVISRHSIASMLRTLATGMTLACLIAASHWLPHFSW